MGSGPRNSELVELNWLKLLHEIAQYLDNHDRRSLRLVSRACAREGLQCLLQEIHVELSVKSMAHLSVLSLDTGFCMPCAKGHFHLPEAGRQASSRRLAISTHARGDESTCCHSRAFSSVE